MIPDSTGTQQPTGGPQERISSLRAAILRISGSLGLDTALREIAGSIRCSSAPASSILDTTVGSARYLRADYSEDPAQPGRCATRLRPRHFRTPPLSSPSSNSRNTTIPANAVPPPSTETAVSTAR